VSQQNIEILPTSVFELVVVASSHPTEFTAILQLTQDPMRTNGVIWTT
jgi:hypothetical protein